MPIAQMLLEGRRAHNSKISFKLKVSITFRSVGLLNLQSSLLYWNPISFRFSL